MKHEHIYHTPHYHQVVHAQLERVEWNIQLDYYIMSTQHNIDYSWSEFGQHKNPVLILLPQFGSHLLLVQC